MPLYGTVEDLRDEVVYLHATYEKPVLNDKKVTDRTQFVMDAQTSLTLRSKFKVKGHQQWYATHRLEVVYLHAKYAKLLQPGHDFFVKGRGACGSGEKNAT
jgi:acyl-CoA thioesterase FadM